MRCVDCEYKGSCFDASVVGVNDGAFTFRAKCPRCGSPKVLFTTGEFEDQLRILIAKKEVNISDGTINLSREGAFTKQNRAHTQR